MAGYEHITKMEHIFNTQQEKIEQLNTLLDEIEIHQREYQMLIEYYYSKQRNQDLEDDKNHRIPDEMMRGVLSEDGIYDFMGDYYETGIRLMEIGLKMIKER